MRISSTVTLYALAALVFAFPAPPAAASPYTVSSPTTSKGTKVKLTFEDKDNGVKETTTMPKFAFETPLIDRVLEFKVATSYRRVDLAGSGTEDGLGDSEVKLKWAVASGKAGTWRPGFALEPKFVLPTGSESKGLGGGATSFELPLIFGWKFDRMELGTELGYAHTFGRDDDEAMLGVLGQYTLTRAVKLGAELVAEAPTDDFGDYVMSANLGIKWKLPFDIEMQGLIGRTVHTRGRDTDKLKLVFSKYL